jgi:hypothetical protein
MREEATGEEGGTRRFLARGRAGYE